MKTSLFVYVTAAALTVAGAGAARAVLIVPDAVSDVFAAANAVTNFLNQVPGAAQISAGQCSIISGGVGCGHANAGTAGFFSPSVSAPGLLSNVGQAAVDGAIDITAGTAIPGTIAVASDATAHLLFYVGVVPLAGAPSGVVPINVGYSIGGSGHLNAVNGGFNTFAQISVGLGVNGANAGGAFTDFVGTNASHADVRTLFIDTSDSTEDLLRIDLQVRASLSVGDSFGVPNPSGFVTAMADPSFEIDPGFQFRDFFQLVFSPNLAPAAAAPEPSALLLLGTGFIALLFFAAFKVGPTHAMH